MMTLIGKAMTKLTHSSCHQYTQRPQELGITPEHLSKIWQIDILDAWWTIETTSQTSVCTNKPTLSKNYSTNDRML